MQRIATGRAQFSDSWPITADSPNPGLAIQCAQLSEGESLSRVLTLGGVGRGDPSETWPPGESQGGTDSGGGVLGAWQAGFVDAAGAIGEVGQRYASAILEYGIGAVQARAVFDWRPGSYQLPPCTYVRIGVLPWGAWGSISGTGIADLKSCGFSATISTGTCQARVPICSGKVDLAAARSLRVPAKAAAFEVLPVFGAGIVTVTSDQQPMVVRDSSLLSAYPPWSPVQLSTVGVDTLLLTPSAAMTVALQFFLSL